MDFTLSNSYDTDAGTGQRMHEDAKAIPTVWSGKDANSIIWSLMEIVKAAGLAGLQFDKANPATYQLLLKAIRLLGQQSGAPGNVFYTARSTPPPGSIKANGAAVSRTAYADLFAAIGTTYGAGDGATTFNVPEGRAEFIRGLDDGRNIDVGRLLGSWQDGTWLRTVAQEWSGGDGADSSKVHIGNGYAQEDGRISNMNVGGAVPTGAKNPAGGGYNTATTDNTVNGEQVVDSAASLNNWIRFRSRNIALLACVKY